MASRKLYYFPSQTLQSHISLPNVVSSDTCNLILLFKSSTKSGDFANDSVNKCQMHHSLTTAKRFVHLYATLNALQQVIRHLYRLICKCSWTNKWIGKGNISFDHHMMGWKNFLKEFVKVKVVWEKRNFIINQLYACSVSFLSTRLSSKFLLKIDANWSILLLVKNQKNWNI